jgi:uncharacterized protein YaiL (DUF2058 family)
MYKKQNVEFKSINNQLYNKPKEAKIVKLKQNHSSSSLINQEISDNQRQSGQTRRVDSDASDASTASSISPIESSDKSFLIGSSAFNRKTLKNSISLSSIDMTFESTKSLSDEDENDVSGEFLTKLYVIKDYKAQLIYGDLTVKRGECVYLICETDSYCFVENNAGMQGFIPKESCIDLDDTLRKAKLKMQIPFCKVTSL